MTDRPPLPYDFHPEVPSFELRSDDVADGQMMSENQVFDGFGMTGGNISPRCAGPVSRLRPRASRSPASTRTRRPVRVSGTGSCSAFPPR